MRVIAGVLCVVLAACAGCGPTRNDFSPPDLVTQVDAIELWANPPVAVNWNDVPGPDGVRVSAFLYQIRGNKVTSVLVEGTLEFFMYDGRVDDADVSRAKPMQTWRFNGQEMAALVVRGPPGWGYAVQLGWGDNAPKSSRVTMILCYKSPKGAVTFSRPLVIGAA
jgi:hypothetical protein